MYICVGLYIVTCVASCRLDKVAIHEAADRTAACVNDPNIDWAVQKLWAQDYTDIIAR